MFHVFPILFVTFPVDQLTPFFHQTKKTRALPSLGVLSRAIDGDIVVVEKLEDAEALERADKRLRREVADPDFGKTDAQPSTTDAWDFYKPTGTGGC